jgi:PAS domain S-box-containing protein
VFQGENLSERAAFKPDSYWQMIAESIPHIVWVASSDGRIEYMNEQASIYTGWSRGAPLNDIGPAILHPDDVADFYRAWHGAVRAGSAYSSEYRLRRADGEYRWHCGRGRPLRDASGEVIKWIGTATEIDAHKRSEAVLSDAVERLREVGDRLAEAQSLARIGSWSVDLTRGTRLWSDELYRLLGHEAQAFEPDDERFFERLHPDDASRVRAAFRGQASRTEPWDDEFRIVLPSGELRWLTAHTKLVKGDAGKVVRIVGTSQDVTDRKLAEEQLRFQAHLLDAVGEAVIATDLDGTVIYWGPGAEGLYGWPAQDAQGRRIMDLLPTVESSYEAAEVMGHPDQGERWAGTMPLARRDGSTFIAEITRTAVLDDAGQVVALIGTSADVSEREKAIADLERAHRSAEETLMLLTTLQAEAPVGFGFVDRDLRLVRLNQEMASMLGVRVEEVAGTPLFELLPPALWEQVEPVYRHVLTSGEAVRGQRVVDAQGTSDTREIATTHYPVRVGGEIIGVGVVFLDVTDRVRADRFRSAVMSQVGEGVCTLDRNGRLTSLNSAASKMLGWTESELRGRYMHEVVNLHQPGGTLLSATERVFLTPESPGPLEQYDGELFTRKDGSTFPVAYSAVPLRIGTTVEGVVVVFRDVSEAGSSPNVIRVLIVDPDKTAARSFQALLDRHEGIEVVGLAATSATALEAVERLRPAVVLVNYELAERDGLKTARMIKFANPSTSVILMTATYDDTIALESIDAGCAGLLDKSRAWVELVSAVRAAYHGETIISQGELQRVLSKVRGGGHTGRATSLTDREEEVLACMREGLSNAQVAERLGVTSNTVRNHVQRILFKLNVHSKLEAVVVTSREGLPQDGP